MVDSKNQNDTKEKEPTKEALSDAPLGTKKKMPKVLKLALLGVGGFVVVVAVLVGLFFSVSSGATKASDEFLNAMQAGDGLTAYQLFSTEAKEIVPEEEFTNVVDQIGSVLNTEEKKISTNISAETGSDTEAVVAYEIEGTDGKNLHFLL